MSLHCAFFVVSIVHASCRIETIDPTCFENENTNYKKKALVVREEQSAVWGLAITDP